MHEKLNAAGRDGGKGRMGMFMCRLVDVWENIIGKNKKITLGLFIRQLL